MSLKFGRIQPRTAELAALTNLKNLLLENYSKYFDDLLSGERSLPFGLLVCLCYHLAKPCVPLNCVYCIADCNVSLLKLSLKISLNLL